MCVEMLAHHCLFSRCLALSLCTGLMWRPAALSALENISKNISCAVTKNSSDTHLRTLFLQLLHGKACSSVYLCYIDEANLQKHMLHLWATLVKISVNIKS